MGKVPGMKLFLQFVLLVILYCAHCVNSYSEGAPSGACNTMTPGHSGTSPQNGHSPYTIQLSSTNVKGGETVDVTLGTTGPPFAGFLSIGSKASSSFVPVGFMLPSVGGQGLTEVKAVPCKTGEGLTHKNSEPKSKVTFQWKAPNEEGDYVVLTSFVKNYGTYWVKESSPVLHVTKDSEKKDTQQSEAQGNPKAVASKIVQDRLEGTYANCGVSKGCFGIPAGCVPTKTCEIVTTWRVEGANYLFQIAGTLPTDSGLAIQGHVSMGFSADTSMGSDSVVGCVWRGEAVEPRSYYTVAVGTDNAGFEDPYVGLGSHRNGSYLEGWLFCEFSRDPIVTVPELGITFNLEQNQYHILLARAPYMSTTKNKQPNTKALEKLGKHPDIPDRDVSGAAFAMTDYAIAGSKSTLLIQLHGAVMVIAWVMTSSLGIFVARYYKQTHTDFNPFNKGFWFVVHVGSMFLTLLLMFSGVILIFVEIGGYSSSIDTQAGKAHPILGLVLTGICCLQLTIGILRPHPGTPKRPIFNWVHWTAGNVGHIVGVACIFLASELSKSGVQNSFPWLLTVGLFVLFHVLMHGTLSIHTVWADKQMNVENKLRGVSMGPMKPSKPGEAPGTGLRTFLLLLYIGGLLSFGITLITLIVQGNQK